MLLDTPTGRQPRWLASSGHTISTWGALQGSCMCRLAHLSREHCSCCVCISWHRRRPFFIVSVDSLMNLDLLLWGARAGGPAAWHDMAVRHALQLAAHHVREDGSTYHVVDYNPSTGKVQGRYTHQASRLQPGRMMACGCCIPLLSHSVVLPSGP